MLTRTQRGIEIVGRVRWIPGYTLNANQRMPPSARLTMPSPFPGMDPYLEGPRFFADFHDSMIVYLMEALQPVLPERYFAQSGDRIWVEASKRNVYPDVCVTQELVPHRPPADMGSVAVLEPDTDPAILVDYEYQAEEEREIFLDIFTLNGRDRELVTSIEILSPTNKSPGLDARGIYRAKQREMLAAGVHLIEIDLLRGGTHTTAAPRERVEQKFGAFDYHVCLRRCGDSHQFRVYPIRLLDKLPVIVVPLKSEDGYVRLDLQAVFIRCYNARAYHKAIDYRHDPVLPPLTDEQAAWAKSLFASEPAPTTPSP